MEKSDKKPPMNKFQLEAYLFNGLYLNMCNVKFPYLEIFELRLFSGNKKNDFSKI